jgi:hypothetical protein
MEPKGQREGNLREPKSHGEKNPWEAKSRGGVKPKNKLTIETNITCGMRYFRLLDFP